jgi:phage protein D
MTDSNFVPEYKVKVDGQEINLEDDLFLQSILVDLRRQAPASVELQFNNNAGTYDNEDAFAPGNEIEIALGYTQQEKKVVFTGEIIGTEVRLSGKTPRVFIVRAFDFLHRMTRGRKTRTFLEQKFSDIVSQVAGDASLSPEVDDTTFSREYVIQHNQTDLDFTRAIAGWLDFDLHIRHREGPTKLRFKKPEVTGDAQVKAVFEKPDIPAGDAHLRRFAGRLSLARVVSEVTVRGWNPAEKKEIVGKASNLYGAMGGQTPATDEVKQKWGETDRQIVDYKVFSQDEADKIAETKLNEYARTFITADIEIQGNAEVQPGGIVEVSLAGPRYDGKYFVERVTHTFLSKVGPEGGYMTRFTGARCDW